MVQALRRIFTTEDTEITESVRKLKKKQDGYLKTYNYPVDEVDLAYPVIFSELTSTLIDLKPSL